MLKKVKKNFYEIMISYYFFCFQSENSDPLKFMKKNVKINVLGPKNRQKCSFFRKVHFLRSYRYKFSWTITKKMIYDMINSRNIFFELCRLFCDLHGPCTTTSHWPRSNKKNPVITDIIENNISLRVICETIFLYFVAELGTLFNIFWSIQIRLKAVKWETLIIVHMIWIDLIWKKVPISKLSFIKLKTVK